MSYDAKNIALYFFQLDKDESLFSKDKMVEINSTKMYEGNIRVNKYLHIAQNLHIAKYGKKLFENDLYAYDNGGIVRDVQLNYQVLKHLKPSDYTQDIDADTQEFLKKIFYILKNAPLKELIKISHEDEEWIECHQLPRGRQIMNPLRNAEEYRVQYNDVIRLLDKPYLQEEISKI